MTDVVFQVIDTLRIGGAERMAVDVSNGLAERCWAVHLFATRGLGPLQDDLDAAVTVHDLARRSRWDIEGLRRFRRAVHRDRPAIVHAHGWSSLQFATVGLLGVRRPPPLVFHDHRPAGLDALGFRYRAAAWPLVRAHVAVDRALLDGDLTTRRRLVRAVIPNGIPLERLATKPRYDRGTPVRGVVLANLRPQKDHPLLLHAVDHLRAGGLDLHVDLVGAADDPAYLAVVTDCATELGLAGSFALLGSRDDAGQLLAGYDVGLLSSHTESGPLALIEYLAAGLPFVVTDVGEIPALLPTSLRRWVVPPRDADAFAAKVRELCALRPDERATIGRESQEFARSHLSIERTIDELEAVYRQIREPTAVAP